MNRKEHRDANGKLLSIDDKVHILGKGDNVLWVVEIGETVVGVSRERNGKVLYGILSSKLVKFKNQN